MQDMSRFEVVKQLRFKLWSSGLQLV